MCGVFSFTSVWPNKPATTLPCKLGPPPLDVIVYSVTYVRTYLCFSHPVATYVDFAIHSNLTQLSFITLVSNFPSNVGTYVGGCTPTPAMSMACPCLVSVQSRKWTLTSQTTQTRRVVQVRVIFVGNPYSILRNPPHPPAPPLSYDKLMVAFSCN